MLICIFLSVGPEKEGTDVQRVKSIDGMLPLYSERLGQVGEQWRWDTCVCWQRLLSCKVICEQCLC
ncbi:hypothetical protein KSF_109590 [Reticulibacter mediterranei]|uniref:Uncharacterized protein n=1 Tax=Reticulibacter mediterranei TaxID=2778369 RepID=A0A8J3J562_9CHLR|nr:hypothetical protein KSF_109590 [Reticulibacter mediterranei]